MGTGRPFDRQRDLPQLAARFGLAILVLAVQPLAPQLTFWPLAVLLSLGLFAGTAGVLAISAAFWVLAQQPFDPPHYLVLLGLAPVVRRLRIRGPGPFALDPLPWRTWFPRIAAHPQAQRGPSKLTRFLQSWYRDYPSFDLRYSVGFALLPAGLWFTLRPVPGLELLGPLWLVLGTLLNLGLLGPWASLVAAPALLLGIPATGSIIWVSLALPALASAFVDDERLSLDGWLRLRRGGVLARQGRIAMLAPLLAKALPPSAAKVPTNGHAAPAQAPRAVRLRQP